MRSEEILEVLDCIKASTSLNAKVELIKAFSTDYDFMNVLELAYNPLKRFNMLQLPDMEPSDGNFTIMAWAVLDQLADGTLSGDSAKAAVASLLKALNPSSQELFRRIVNKDLRADFGPKLINKAVKGFIKIEPYMRCSLPKHVDMSELKYPLFSQLKMDGMFMTVTHTDIVRIATRQGKDFPEGTFKEIRDFAKRKLPKGSQLQGELLFQTNGQVLERATSNGLANTALKTGEMPENALPAYYVWDIVTLADIQFGSAHVYIDRFAKVKELADYITVFPVISRTVNNFEQAIEHFEQAVADKQEGTILKVPGSRWKNGTSREQIKLKGEATCELIVTNYLVGNGKYAGMVGSLECQSSCGRLEVYVSGFSDDLRKYMTQYFQSQILGSIIEVKHNGVTKSKVKNVWSLLHPRFVELRLDKSEADDLSDIDPRGGFEPPVKSDGEDFYSL